MRTFLAIVAITIAATCSFLLLFGPASDYTVIYVAGVVFPMFYGVWKGYRWLRKKVRSTIDGRLFADVAHHLHQAAERIATLERSGHKLVAAQREVEILQSRVLALQADDVGLVAKRTAAIASIGALESALAAFQNSDGSDFDADSLVDRLENIDERLEDIDKTSASLPSLIEKAGMLKQRAEAMVQTHAECRVQTKNVHNIIDSLLVEHHNSSGLIVDLEVGDDRYDGTIDEQVSALEERADDIEQRLNNVADVATRLPNLSARATELRERVKPLEESNSGVVDMLESISDTLDELLNEDGDDGIIFDIESGSDSVSEDEYLPEQVDMLEERVKEITKKLDELVQVAPRLAALRLQAEELTARTKPLAHSYDGLGAQIEAIQNLLDKLLNEDCDEGLIAELESGDANFDGDLAQQVDTLKRRASVIADHLKRLTAHANNVSKVASTLNGDMT